MVNHPNRRKGFPSAGHIRLLLAEATELLRNAQYADGEAMILTHDAEALERAVAKVRADLHRATGQ